MTFRRVLWASPLAVSVAVLAHLVAFGPLHAPGGDHAAALLGTLGVSLLLALAGAFAGGVFGATPWNIATERRSRYAPLLLAAGGAAAYGLIELSEGHFALSAFLTAALASLPLAYLVARAAGFAGRAARAAGIRCAVFMARSERSGGPAALGRNRRRELAGARVALSTRRGRAPPVLA